MMNIGKTIKMLRTAAGLNQKEFAARLGVSASLLSLIEKGEREPTVSFLKSVSRDLGVPISVLFVERGDVPAGLSRQQADDYIRVQELLADVLKSLMMEKFQSHETQRPAADERARRGAEQDLERVG